MPRHSHPLPKALPETGETEGNLPEATLPENEKTREKSRAFVTLAGSTGNQRVERMGVAPPPHKLPAKPGVSPLDDANSDAVSNGTAAQPAESPALLGLMAAAWNRLSDADRAAVVELAEQLAAAVRDGVAVDE